MRTKIAIVLAMFATSLVAVSSLAGQASAVTVEQLKSEVAAVDATVATFTQSDLSKPIPVKRFQIISDKITDRVVVLADKGMMKASLSVTKVLLRLYDKLLTDSAMSKIEAQMSATIDAIK